MKALSVIGVALLAGLSTSPVFADCSSSPVVGNPENILKGHVVVGSDGGDSWHEEHCASGDLWDYKLGPGVQPDPSEKVGVWSAQPSGDVKYTYSGSDVFNYKLRGSNTYNSGGTWYLCGTKNITVTISDPSATVCP